jgi:hypothetical protein
MITQLVMDLQSWQNKALQTIKSWIWTFISHYVYAMYVKL